MHLNRTPHRMYLLATFQVINERRMWSVMLNPRVEYSFNYIQEHGSILWAQDSTIFLSSCADMFRKGSPTNQTHVMYRAPRSYVPLLQFVFSIFCAAPCLVLPRLSSRKQTELMDSDPICFCIRSHAVTLRHPVQSDCKAAITKLHPLQGPHPSTSTRLLMSSNYPLRKRRVLAGSQ